MVLFEKAHPTKTPSRTKSQSLPLLIEIASSAELLNDSLRQSHLKSIEAILPSPIYKKYYKIAVARFAVYVQQLPGNALGAFSTLGGLLDQGLSRATYALTLCLRHFHKGSPNFNHIQSSQAEALWLYCLFITALFLDISCLITEYKVKLYDSESQPIGAWMPVIGTMLEAGASYYSVEPMTAIAPSMPFTSAYLGAALLERAYDTRGGFHWLASHPEILESWLAVLAGEESRMPMSEVMTLIPFADKAAVDKRLQLLKGLPNKQSLFHENIAIGQERLLAERFLQWLRERIAAGEVSVNASDNNLGVRVTLHGVLIARSLLKQFSDLNQQDAKVVEQQFQEMVALYASSILKGSQAVSALDGRGPQAALGQWLMASQGLIFSIGKVPPRFSLDHAGFGMPATVRPLIK